MSLVRYSAIALLVLLVMSMGWLALRRPGEVDSRADRSSGASAADPAAPDEAPAAAIGGTGAEIPPAETPPTGVLRVEVRGLGGAVLPDAWAIVEGRKGTTAGEGVFIFDGLPARQHHVDAIAPGHPPVRKAAMVSAGTETPVRIELVPGGLPIAGRVFDSLGDPVVGARIGVIDHSRDWWIFAGLPDILTGPDGTFRVDGLPDGLLTITANAPLTRQGVQRRVSPGRLDLEFVLRPAGEIHGRVIATGIAGAVSWETVSLIIHRVAGEEPDGFWEPLSGGWTFRRTGLVTGRYLIRVRAVDGRVAEVEVDVRAGHVSNVEIPLVADGLVLEGYVVTRDSNEPVVGALVVAEECAQGTRILWSIAADEQARTNGAVTAITDEEGRYRLRGLFPGAWTVIARATGLQREVAHDVMVPGDGPRFRLGKAGAIEVLVLRPDGTPVLEAWVSVSFDLRGEEGSSAYTDASGRCRVESVPPGRHPIEVSVDDPDWEAELEVTVALGEVARVTIRPPNDGCLLTGRLTGEDRPAKNRRISVEFTDTAGVTFGMATTCDADGTFRVQHLCPGPARVFLRPGARGAGSEIVLTPGVNILDLEPPTGELRLVVVDAATGAPLAAQVGVQGRYMGTGPTGCLHLTGLAEVESHVFVSGNGRETVRLRVTPSRSPEALRVPLKAAVALTVLVVDRAGAPVPGADVVIRDASGWDLAGAAEDLGRSRAMAGKRLFMLAPGTYDIEVHAPGFEHHSDRLEIPVPEGEITVSLDLK
jgi:Carboxypeptidase regulatory-like domain